MKHTEKNLLKSGICLILVLCMVLSLVPVSALHVAAETTTDNTNPLDVDGDGVVTYVSFGDSVTNGYGLDGYRYDPPRDESYNTNPFGFLMEPEAAYPVQLANKLEDDGYNVKHYQMALSATRMEELRYLLDESYEPDAYHIYRFHEGDDWYNKVVFRSCKQNEAFENYVKANYPQYNRNSQSAAGNKEVAAQIMQDIFRGAAEEADLITISLGNNNFGTFLTTTIQYVLGLSAYLPPADFSVYVDEETAASLDAIIDMMAAGMVGMEGAPDPSDPNYQTFVLARTLARCLMYGYLGYTEHYDAMLDALFEINPNVNVVVLDMYSMLSGIDMVGETFGDAVDIDQLYSMFVNLANYYTRHLSPYAQKVTHATLDETPDLVMDYYKDYEKNRANNVNAATQFLHPTAYRLLNEFVMEMKFGDPDDQSTQDAFQENVLGPVAQMDDNVNNLTELLETKAMGKVNEGLKTAVQGAEDGVDLAVKVVPMTLGILEQLKAELFGSSRLAIFQVSRGEDASATAIRDALYNEIAEAIPDEQLTSNGLSVDMKPAFAKMAYDMACAYYDVCYVNGTYDAAKEADAQQAAVIYGLTQMLILRGEEDAQVAQKTATQAWGLNAFYQEALKKEGATAEAARLATILFAIGTEYPGEGVAEAIYGTAKGTANAAQKKAVYTMILKDQALAEGAPKLGETVAAAVAACYVDQLDCYFENENVQTVLKFFMVAQGIADSADEAEELYGSYLTYKNMAITFSQIAQCPAIYFDKMLTAANKYGGNLMGAIGEKFAEGTLVLTAPNPADYVGGVESDEYKTALNTYMEDSALATLYVRFMGQDGVFTHPSEIGQDKMYAAIVKALDNMIVTSEKEHDVYVDQNTTILSIGDAMVAEDEENNYTAQIAAKLGVATDNITYIQNDNARLEDFYNAMIGDEGDAFAQEFLVGNKAVDGAALNAAIEENDVILVNLGAMNLGFSAIQMGKYLTTHTTYQMKFSSFENMGTSSHNHHYPDEKLYDSIDGLLANFQNIFGATGDSVTDETAQKMVLMLLLESYGYGLTGFINDFDSMMAEIRELNPDATIILVGLPDLLADTYFEGMGMKMQLGKFYLDGSIILNGHMEKYAEQNAGVFYLDGLDAETVSGTMDAMNLAALMGDASNAGDLMTSAQFTQAGHTAVAEKLNCIADNERTNVDEEAHFCVSNQGKIHCLCGEIVQEFIYGDVNGDGAVTQRDVTILRRYLAGGYDVEINEAAADVNGDGAVTQRDVTNLRKYLAGGYDVTLGKGE